MPKHDRATGHTEGSHTGARITSLIETCKINNIDPNAYLRQTREAITSGHPKSQIDDPMPWAFIKTSSRSQDGQSAPLAVQLHNSFARK
ncbi:MAG: transposase domain-containing protein [Candidatus Saccharibacteria bacterium]|nr:transposase domain-containing protein [Pseudorhodobacter sp.]